MSMSGANGGRGKIDVWIFSASISSRVNRSSAAICSLTSSTETMILTPSGVSIGFNPISTGNSVAVFAQRGQPAAAHCPRGGRPGELGTKLAVPGATPFRDQQVD